MTLTLDNLSPLIDAALRDKARAENRPVEDVAAEAIARGLGVVSSPIKNNLGRFAGTMTREDADIILRHVQEMDNLDLKSRENRTGH